jgi:hypothetical protein
MISNICVSLITWRRYKLLDLSSAEHCSQGVYKPIIVLSHLVGSFIISVDFILRKIRAFPYSNRPYKICMKLALLSSVYYLTVNTKKYYGIYCVFFPIHTLITAVKAM